MGVMECSRLNCGSIMCDTYINDIGYICGECKEEFKEYLESIDKPEISEGEMKRLLAKFMNTSKDSFTDGEVVSVDEFFDSYKREN